MFDKLFSIINPIEPEVSQRTKAATPKVTAKPEAQSNSSDKGMLIGFDPFNKKIEGTKPDRIKQKMELLKKLQKELESMK